MPPLDFARWKDALFTPKIMVSASDMEQSRSVAVPKAVTTSPSMEGYVEDTVPRSKNAPPRGARIGQQIREYAESMGHR